VSDLGRAADTTYDDLVRMAEQQAAQWGGLHDSVTGTINKMMFSSDNQAPAEDRLRAMKKWLKSQRGFDSFEEAESYSQGLQQYLGYAQEAYDRPSNEYAKAYEFAMKGMLAVQEMAAQKQDEALQIAIDSRDLLAQIAYNTSGGGGSTQSGAMSVEDVLAILRSPRGSAEIKNVLRFS
jgi:hypothetical protein